MPSAQHPQADVFILVRKAGPSVLPQVRRIVADADPNLPIVNATTLADATAFGLTLNQAAAWVAGLAGALGLVLAAMGVYGITAYHVGRRRREIGLRMALGATQANLLRLILQQSTRLAAVGLLVGVALAVAASTVLRSLLVGVSSLDLASFAGGISLLALVLLAATLLPTRRALAVHPVTALRAD